MKNFKILHIFAHIFAPMMTNFTREAVLVLFLPKIWSGKWAEILWEIYLRSWVQKKKLTQSVCFLQAAANFSFLVSWNFYNSNEPWAKVKAEVYKSCFCLIFGEGSSSIKKGFCGCFCGNKIEFLLRNVSSFLIQHSTMRRIYNAAYV